MERGVTEKKWIDHKGRRKTREIIRRKGRKGGRDMKKTTRRS